MTESADDAKMLKLFEAVYDQIASAQDVEALDHWLRDNPEGQRRYLEFLDTQHEIERQIAGITPPDNSDTAVHAPSGKGTPSGKRTAAVIPAEAGRILALAASLLVIVGSSWWVIDRLAKDSPSTAAMNVESRAVLGIVTASDNAVGNIGTQTLEPGTAVRAGTLRLASGKLQVRLESGVELLISGQTELDFTSGQLVELVQGSVTADVPDSVIGFSVKTPGLNVVDLGTTFGVSLPPGGEPRVHVFDGVVDAEIESNSKRTRLTDQQTARFDGSAVVQAAFDASLFVEPEDRENATPVTTGDVRFLHTPPHSVERGRFEHDFVLCFRERRSPVRLKQDLALSLDAPGHYRVTPKWKNFGTIPEGTLVDSYFVHLDAIGKEKRLREGAITFDRPILGVVFSSQLLAEQNDLLGNSGTTYTSGRTNPKHDPTLENETVTLSADRRTVRFSWLIRSRSDQVRIIVAADES